MIIKSKFKDYYDSALSYGIDTERLWIRDRQEISIPSINKKLYASGVGRWRWKTLSAVGFCGKIYPFLLNSSQNCTTECNYSIDKNDIIYDESEIRKNILSDDTYDYYKKLNKPVRWDIWDEQNFKKFWNQFSDPEIDSIFSKYKTPVFSIQYYDKNWHVILNDCLKHLAFFKVMNPIETFSEIEMYIGNILVGEKEVKIPTGNDQVIAASKGFDKWSFRKESTEKK